MTGLQERLAYYIKQHGPVPVAYVMRGGLYDQPGFRSYWWQVKRAEIRLGDDEAPIYVEQKNAGPVRRSPLQADFDLQSIVAKEGRIVFRWAAGELTADACEEVLGKLAELTGRDELWK